ncbi:uncharacterized protein K02A2.6-like [Lacerta agilis]|uniref:uncharacterized protein K02A2.6-like n=1 Tax=Lacerta agilis TaxID=80427 RepID=UPI001419854B|nr:uncharacterized protein K02A2.6-like [Lacerta agilis]
MAPKNIEDCSFDELTKAMTGHLAPQPSKNHRRYDFAHREQQAHESVNEYIAALREIAMYCQFTNLEERLLERFIVGVRDSHLRRKLLAKDDITMATAMNMAMASEKDNAHGRAPISRAEGGTHRVQRDRSSSGNSPEDVHRTLGQPDRNRRSQAARKSNQHQSNPHSTCASCGENHDRKTCRFRDVTCRGCGKAGHIMRVCRSKNAGIRPRRRVHEALEEVELQSISSDRVYQFPSLGSNKLRVQVRIEGKPCNMELDTGSSYSIISDKTFRELFPKRPPPLRPATVVLRDFQRNIIQLRGMGTFKVQFKNHIKKLDLIITKGPFTSLLGLAWFGPLGLSVSGLNQISPGTGFESICQEFPSVFDGTLGLYKGPPISLQINPMVQPIRVKARRVPFALKPKIEEELDRLVAQGVLEPVTSGSWETPIVTPVKPDGSVRICGDYKCTLNRALQDHAYPVPIVSHVLANLAGAKVFGKLDLAQAYQQLPVDEATADAQTIVTHKGAFRVKRLQFGISVAPGVFQSLMDHLLKGIPGVTPFFDDVLIAAPSREDFAASLRTVLQRFQAAGLKVKQKKCLLGVNSVDFLGFRVDADGLHPTEDKVRAICDAPAPKNKAELQAFLGLLNFYHAFLPHKAAVAEPLHRLLDKKACWVWGPRQAKSFQGVKELLISNSVLMHFDENLPVVLACDASPYGVGAVLGHQLSDGREVPVAYFSQTLTPAERNYSQIDKEGLAVVKGVKKIHDFLYGRPFTIVTDHKPLLGLLAPDRQTPQMLSPRVLRWSIFLAGYQYSLEHRPGKAMGHADALSRLPLPENGPDPAPAHQIMQLEDLPDQPLHVKDVAAATAKDRLLARVAEWVGRGWPEKPGPEFSSFTARKDELSSHRGCILWGSRVIVPPSLRRKVLEGLHVSHPGIVWMKALARSYVWWPGIDAEIEGWVKHCEPCQVSRPDPPKAPVQSWESTRSPWSRVHIDYAGPFQGQLFLIVVDSHSKWLKVTPTSTMSSRATINSLRKLFATHGLPDTLVSDNGTAFTSAEFQEFVSKNGIRHIRSAPFHPATNGQAERMVRTTKDALRRIIQGDWTLRLSEFLLAQHVTPSATTGHSPAELLMGRRLTTLLDRIHPDRALEQRPHTVERKAPKGFAPGDPVYVRNYGFGPGWVPGTIERCTGPVSYEVRLEGGLVWKRHLDQIRPRSSPDPVRPEEPQGSATDAAGDLATGTSGETEGVPPTETPQQCDPGPVPTAAPQPATPAEPPRLMAPISKQGLGDVPQSQVQTPELRWSQRERKRPTHLKDFICS